MGETSKLCPACGAPNIISARFCIACGQSLGTAVTGTKTHASLTNAVGIPQLPANTHSNVLAIPQKPARLQRMSFLYLIDSVINVCLGLLWLAPICTAPLGVYSFVVGIFEFLYVLKILPDPIKPDQDIATTTPLTRTSKFNKGLAIMQVINILSLNIFSFIIGILSLSWIKDKEIEDYLAKINANPPRIVLETSDQLTIFSLYNYQKLSGIFWIALGTLQFLTITVSIFYCLLIIVALVGLRKIFVGISRCKVSSRII